MSNSKNYIGLKDLVVYQIARELSVMAWEIYASLSWEDRKIIGHQFITSTDSVGANIAEGYSRFHYLDKIKFYYNARASLSEAGEHWIELLFERGKITKEKYNQFSHKSKSLSVKLNNFITSTYKAKNPS